MGKRHSSRRSSQSALSPVPDYEDDSAADVSSKPSKRLKAANGAAVPTSPSSPSAARDAAEPEDEEMKDGPAVETEKTEKTEKTSKKDSNTRSVRRKSSRSSTKPDTNEDDDTIEIEAEADAEVEAEAEPETEAAADVEPEAEPEAEAEAEAETADAADPDATVLHTSNDNVSSSISKKTNGASVTATNGASTSAVTAHHGRNGNMEELLDAMSDVSEDTDGDVPPPKKASQPSAAASSIGLRRGGAAADEEPTTGLNAVNEPQVTVCAWDGCELDDLGTMDKLVEHLHAEHVEGKQRRYTCEWIGCPRKGKSHASAYALKAHLRSHTREKPHVCLLPECDLAFARQDALNKHMRTSHEIDLMRYYEAGQRRVPIGVRSGSSANGSAANGASAAVAATTNGKSNGPNKLKIIIKTPQSHAAGHDDSVDNNAYDDNSLYHYTGAETTVLGKDQGFTSHELELSPKELYGVCRLQLQWAEDESEELRAECAAWEEAAHDAWLEQQVLLDQVINSEKDWYERRKEVLKTLAIEEEKRAAEQAAKEAEEDAAAEAAGLTRGGDPDDDDNDGDGDGDKDDDDSGADDDNDNDDGDGEGDGDDDEDDDVPSVMLDPDATRDDYSFAETTSFSVAGGSSLRNELAVNGD